MAKVTLSDLAKSLLPFADGIWAHARRVHAERRTGRMPLRGEGDLMEQGLDETLRRLCSGKIDDGWWRQILDRIGHKYVAPDFLRKPAIQEWLADTKVQADFKALARKRVMGGEADDPGALARLRHAYAGATGEHERLAGAPIKVTIAILVAGYLASIAPELRALAGMVQTVHQETRGGFEGLGNQFDSLKQQIGPDQPLVEEFTRHAEDELSLIRKRRSLDPARSRHEIRSLAERVMGGPLRFASSQVRAEVLYWASRLHAVESGAIADAKAYRERLLQVDPEADTRIIDALLLEAEEDVGGALQILRDNDSPDGRSAIFAVLRRAGGMASALQWFDEQADRDNPDFLTGIGWSNVVGNLAEAGRWNDAVRCVAVSQGKVDEWPDLAYVGGVVNAAMLLPVEFRALALKGSVIYSQISTTEVADAGRYSAHAHDCFARASRLLDEIDLSERARAAADCENAGAIIPQ